MRVEVRRREEGKKVCEKCGRWKMGRRYVSAEIPASM